MEKKMTTSKNTKEISKLREELSSLKMRIIELVDELTMVKSELLEFKQRAHRDVMLLTETTRELQTRTR
tara:strand:- start:4020 stop:4226 length:207 start_codon:yes stop_codon:yes gene_type:complete